MRLFVGNSNPQLAIAERTRSRASFTSVSAKPTKVKLGKPLARCTSTCTDKARSPIKARECTKANPDMLFIPILVQYKFVNSLTALQLEI